MMMTPQQLALQLPDIPRWVHARAALLSGECDILGSPREDAYIVRSTRSAIATVIGRPSTETLLRAVDIVGSQVELLVMPEDFEHISRVLRYWRQLPATLHLRNGTAGAIETASDRSVRLYDPWTSNAGHNHRAWPTELLHELYAARIVAAKRVDGRVISICHTEAITETLWDAGVDTLDRHRRCGHARACFLAMEHHLQASGIQPVWGALDTNVASKQMAASLDFVPVDRLVVFLSPRRR